MKMTIDMPIVSHCTVSQCTYNVNNNCHAKAITIGDAARPGCDTFFAASAHNRETKRISGVGACKVSQCKHNNDYECSATNIDVGYSSDKILCLKFAIHQTLISKIA